MAHLERQNALYILNRVHEQASSVSFTRKRAVAFFAFPTPLRFLLGLFYKLEEELLHIRGRPSVDHSNDFVWLMFEGLVEWRLF